MPKIRPAIREKKRHKREKGEGTDACPTEADDASEMYDLKEERKRTRTTTKKDKRRIKKEQVT